MIIPAEIHSDDHRYTAPFDALPWFERATSEDIRQLADCGWRGDYPADEVALSYPQTAQDYAAIERVLDYVCTIKEFQDMGFEVSVDPVAARAWVTEAYPGLLTEEGG